MHTKKDDTLNAYIEAINKIDDYFEYSNESLRDKRKVRIILAELTKKLGEIYGQP